MFQDLSTALLTDGYQVRFRAPGHSMSPTIRDGEMVLVAPVKGDEVRRGDILLYRCSERRRVIAHRVVCVEQGSRQTRSFILRGDSSVTCDAPVEASQILGRVTAVERDGRTIQLAGRRARMRRMMKRAGAQLKSLGTIARLQTLKSILTQAGLQK
jgi:signal peptidase I